jgi:ectoine hydroxylase-related dioxygenase (phytanoyl-CoA dioxygenase family)
MSHDLSRFTVTPSSPASEIRDKWTREGCLVVRGVYTPGHSARLLAIVERILAQWRKCDPQSGETAGDDATCMRHLNHPAYYDVSNRGELREILEATADANVLNVARTMFTTEPLFRCTSLFFNPQKTSMDGNWHRDSQFVTKSEEEERESILNASPNGHGVQMQIALAPTEDIEVVPGSHLRLDTPEEYHIRLADQQKNNRSNHMPGAVRIRQEPGDAVLFNALALHRGRYHADKLRRTFMLTYSKHTPQAIDYFNTQPWCLEPGYLDGLTPATRKFFERFNAAFQDAWTAPAATK